METAKWDVPERLETDRLVLRWPRMGDGQQVSESVRESERELLPYMPWASPMPEVAQTEQWCRRALSKCLVAEEFHYLIFPKGVDRYAGTLSLMRIEWKVPKGEIGYWLRTGCVGRGYMTEAVQAITRLAFDLLDMERMEIRCDDDNVRSARVAELAGYKLEGILRHDALRPDGSRRDTRVHAMLRA